MFPSESYRTGDLIEDCVCFFSRLHEELKMAKSDDCAHILQGLLVFGNVVIGVSEVEQVWVEASFQYDAS